jgi:SAM-dependent methyltransferase
VGQTQFWDVLAPHHAAVEDSNLGLASLRRILGLVREPVLVVGAGQGLLVAELRKQGFACDGVDLSAEMIKHARLRRGLALVQADAKSMPFETGQYRTIIYATGVIDFTADEEEIRAILKEGKRIVDPSGAIFVGFYRMSRGLENFLKKTGLLKNNVLSHRQCLEMYLLNPVETIAWVARQAGVSYFRSASLVLRMSALTTMQEKMLTFRVQRIFANREVARALIQAAPEKMPYRNEAEIESLFTRLEIPTRKIQLCGSCVIVQI